MSFALVIGSGENVWQEVQHARDLVGEFDAVYCVNQSGIDYPGAFDFWVTLHPEFIDKFSAERRSLGLSNGYAIVAPLEDEIKQHAKKGNVSRRVSYKWERCPWSASSGIYAAKVAMEDGHHVVLAGTPMMPIPHYRTKQPWRDCFTYMQGLRESLQYLQGRVKSMSGLTRELLGDPTEEWIKKVRQ